MPLIQEINDRYSVPQGDQGLSFDTLEKCRMPHVVERSEPVSPRFVRGILMRMSRLIPELEAEVPVFG